MSYKVCTIQLNLGNNPRNLAQNILESSGCISTLFSRQTPEISYNLHSISRLAQVYKIVIANYIHASW